MTPTPADLAAAARCLVITAAGRSVTAGIYRAQRSRIHNELGLDAEAEAASLARVAAWLGEQSLDAEMDASVARVRAAAAGTAAPQIDNRCYSSAPTGCVDDTECALRGRCEFKPETSDAE